MSLIKCPECNKEVSSDAVFCPHCGKPLKAIEAEVIDNNKEPEQIVNYRNEIKTYQSRRTIMITIGIILAVLGFGLIIASIIIYVNEMIKLTETNLDGLGGAIGAYLGMVLSGSFMLMGGTALIVVGAVTNSIKIKKRENKIAYYKRTGQVL